MQYGLIPELVGRLPVVTALEELDKSAMVRILSEPRNALIKQYEKLLELEDVELVFAPGALEAIADLAIDRKTGARGLRSILESAMRDVMFDIPSQDDVRRVDHHARDHRRTRCRPRSSAETIPRRSGKPDPRDHDASNEPGWRRGSFVCCEVTHAERPRS